MGAAMKTDEHAAMTPALASSPLTLGHTT